MTLSNKCKRVSAITSVLVSGLLLPMFAQAEQTMKTNSVQFNTSTTIQLSATLNRQFRSSAKDQIKPFVLAMLLLELAKKKRAEKTSSNPKHQAWCDKHYRSYDLKTDTFQPYEGPRKPCRSPYLKIAGK